ncbi:uncharacterized protein KY384_005863 [Bacidia gigantensis]|uniref:uncharacterized protein n=1 Tax=Bacidia gigantensis TaxID=2732470 RepID=UPI001D03A47D|nr:uncharacterized protein KY384_005863 [Bacidia gigantensis]KAG8529228.1 hypothetical protein KY384_005863 [Bacidia gigantensis]
MAVSTTTFDSSGQTFTETLVPATPTVSSWPNRTRGNPNEHKHFLNPLDATTLSSIATRSILIHSSTITKATLSTLPWSIARSLWLNLERNELVSARLWCAFVSTFPEELEVEFPALERMGRREASAQKAIEERTVGNGHEVENRNGALESLRRHTTRIVHARRYPLDAYLGPLLELSGRNTLGKWMAVLTLQNVKASRQAMTQGLSGLRNLICLTLGEGVACEPGHGVDVAIFREWGRYAAEGVASMVTEKDLERCATPFGMLRVLNLRLQPIINAKVFKYLAPLPLLSTINVDRCGIKEADTEVAEDEGWDLLDPDSGHRPQGMTVSHGWEAVAESCLDFARDMEKAPRAIEDAYALPRLHLLLGTDSMMLISDNFQRGQGNRSFVREPVAQRKRAEVIVLGTKRCWSQDKSTSTERVNKKREFKGSTENDEIWRAIAASFPI